MNPNQRESSPRRLQGLAATWCTVDRSRCSDECRYAGMQSQQTSQPRVLPRNRPVRSDVGPALSPPVPPPSSSTWYCNRMARIGRIRETSVSSWIRRNGANSRTDSTPRRKRGVQGVQRPAAFYSVSRLRRQLESRTNGGEVASAHRNLVVAAEAHHQPAIAVGQFPQVIESHPVTAMRPNPGVAERDDGVREAHLDQAGSCHSTHVDVVVFALEVDYVVAQFGGKLPQGNARGGVPSLRRYVTRRCMRLARAWFRRVRGVKYMAPLERPRDSSDSRSPTPVAESSGALRLARAVALEVPVSAAATVDTGPSGASAAASFAALSAAASSAAFSAAASSAALSAAASSAALPAAASSAAPSAAASSAAPSAAASSAAPSAAASSAAPVGGSLVHRPVGGSLVHRPVGGGLVRSPVGGGSLVSSLVSDSLSDLFNLCRRGRKCAGMLDPLVHQVHHQQPVSYPRRRHQNVHSAQSGRGVVRLHQRLDGVDDGGAGDGCEQQYQRQSESHLERRSKAHEIECHDAHGIADWPADYGIQCPAQQALQRG